MVSNIDLHEKIICVIGLGYVGFPLAKAFSKHFKVVGFDVNKQKIGKLKSNNNMMLTSDPLDIKKADFVIIAVPTPVTRSKEPDLSFVKSASRIVGQNLKKDAIVVLESTVYPGVTEEIVGPILEKQSGLILGQDFYIGYSPERVNPGDKAYTIDKITKIVSGMDEKTTNILALLYGYITNVYKTSDIKTAEAAKVIENIQRDLNIALMNELALIFNKMGLDTRSVIDDAATKWNFYRYEPGLVGVHCIPIDPYYLVHKAKELGYNPKVILAGRSINDSAPGFVASIAIKGLNEVGKVIKGSKVLIMGFTYKENVEDTRESPVKDIVKGLIEYEVDLYGYDPLLSLKQINEFNVKAIDELVINFDCVIITVAHDEFKKMTLDSIKKFMNEKPVLIDVRGCFDRRTAEEMGFIYRCL